LVMGDFAKYKIAGIDMEGFDRVFGRCLRWGLLHCDPQGIL
jgi:hypothetical protein